MHSLNNKWSAFGRPDVWDRLFVINSENISHKCYEIYDISLKSCMVKS